MTVGVGLAVAGVAAAGAGIASSAMNKPGNVAPRDYGMELEQTLGAQIRLAPHLYGMEAQYQPLYGQLASRELAASLLGRTGEPETVSWIGEDGVLRTAELPGIPQRGVIDIGAEVLESYGPRYTDALSAADPARARLLDTMTDRAEEGLKLGYALSPDEQRNTVQSIRAAQQARGGGFGPTDIYEEALGLNVAGNVRHGQRMADAANMVNLRNQQLVDPFLAVLGQSRAMPPTQGGPRVFNPEAGGDIYDTNYNAAVARQIAAANNRASTLGGIAGMTGQLAGAYAGYRGNQALAQSLSGNAGPNAYYNAQSANLMARGYGG